MFDNNRADKYYCKNCMPKRNVHYCRLCGVGLPTTTQNFCNNCLNIGKEDLNFDYARAPYLYHDEGVRKIIHTLKYGDAQYLAEYMAEPMVDVIKEQNWQIDAVTYVPLHWRKKQKRGYNQSECLAKHISRSLNIPMVSTLKKTVYTKTSATKLGREERRKLLEGTFALTGENIRGMNILLVDDVMTSKATGNECSKILKEGKARHIFVITYATSRGDSEQTY